MKNTRGLRVQEERPKLTASVALPGGQDRLRQLILYVARKCEDAERMGLIKLNKILWKADFDSFAARGRPVTGRPYQRLALGPAPKEMPPVLRELLRDEMMELRLTKFSDGPVEKRPVAKTKPRLTNFTNEDLSFVDAAIKYYWNKTGNEASDDSHGVAWRSRADKDPMPYELAYLSDDPISAQERASLIETMRRRA